MKTNFLKQIFRKINRFFLVNVFGLFPQTRKCGFEFIHKKEDFWKVKNSKCQMFKNGKIIQTAKKYKKHYKTILDAGCGLGQLTSQLANFGGNVLGIDISGVVIEEAKKRCKNKNVTFKQSDIIKNDINNHWYKTSGIH